VIFSTTTRLYDTDLWSLLVVGKTMWVEHRIPTTDQWTWRHYGEPQIVSSWLFRALLWPLWSRAGELGLYLWRWIATLGAFALLWVTARAMGARGFLALVVVAWCALIYRARTDVRPEMLAALLLAAELWILESRRARSRDPRAGAASGVPSPVASAADPPRAKPRPGIFGDPAVWIVPILWVWANAHISYTLGFVLLAIYLADARLAHGQKRSGGAAEFTPLWTVLIASAAVSFINPYGVRTLVQPFEFLLFWRSDPMFQAIGELGPPTWSENLRNGLPLLMAGWPLLVLRRWRAKGLDLAELAACALLTAAAFTSQRMIGPYALIATPFVARDLSEWMAPRTPAWASPPWRRGLLAATACVAIGIADWLRPELPLGVGILATSVPERACDFIAAHGIRGRGLNEFHFGGYMAYRFWPDRERLPFMSTQPEYATPDDRSLYIASHGDPAAWPELDRRYRFDYLLLDRGQGFDSHLLDFIDLDSSWVMVFTDDAAEVLVRRKGSFGAVADAFGFRVLPAGRAMREQLVARCLADSSLRGRAIGELERAALASPYNGSAHHLLGIFALTDRRLADARRHLELTLAQKPWLPRVHEMLGWIALDQGRPRDALHELLLERRLHAPPRGLDLKLGEAHQQLGQLERARDAYRREVERDPESTEARDSLAAVTRRLGR